MNYEVHVRSREYQKYQKFIFTGIYVKFPQHAMAKIESDSEHLKLFQIKASKYERLFFMFF